MESKWMNGLGGECVTYIRRYFSSCTICVLSTYDFLHNDQTKSNFYYTESNQNILPSKPSNNYKSSNHVTSRPLNHSLQGALRCCSRHSFRFTTPHVHPRIRGTTSCSGIEMGSTMEQRLLTHRSQSRENCQQNRAKARERCSESRATFQESCLVSFIPRHL